MEMERYKLKQHGYSSKTAGKDKRETTTSPQTCVSKKLIRAKLKSRGRSRISLKLRLKMNNLKEKSYKTVEKWKTCDEILDEDEGLGTLFVAWARERTFQLLGLFSLMMCAVLFALQAYLAFRSYQTLHQLSTKREMPEMLYQIYFDGHDWAMNSDKVDLRANTTLFIH